MKTALEIPYYSTTRKGPPKKPRRESASLRERDRLVYPSMDEFLSLYPVAIVNEYGERVISGKRIC